jgi:hypothetical protein
MTLAVMYDLRLPRDEVTFLKGAKTAVNFIFMNASQVILRYVIIKVTLTVFITFFLWGTYLMSDKSQKINK